MPPDPLPLSALQHLLFCERQAMLIHAERLWAENRLTVEGRQLHRKAHEPQSGWKDGIFVARGLDIASERLGLSGKTDIVEFAPPAGAAGDGKRPPALTAPLVGWHITPVEYKRGRPKKDDSDRVQLCAQALCLEEMLGAAVVEGAIFYGRNRRRHGVEFDEPLRAKTIAAAARLHDLFTAGLTPPARREPKCDACSLFHLCLPDAVARGRRAESFVTDVFRRHLAADGPTTDATI